MRCMRISCWITKATDMYLEYVTLFAFRRQQWSYECAQLLRLYVHYMSCCFLPPPLFLCSFNYFYSFHLLLPRLVSHISF